MFYHPEFDPVAFHIGALAVRWYGLMYLIGFALALILGRSRIRSNQSSPMSIREFDDLLFYIVLGHEFILFIYFHLFIFSFLSSLQYYLLILNFI